MRGIQKTPPPTEARSLISPRYHPAWPHHWCFIAPASHTSTLGGLAPATPARTSRSRRPFSRAAQGRVRDPTCTGLSPIAGSLEQDSESVLLPVNAYSLRLYPQPYHD